MTDYTITTDFGAKDSLPSGNAAKVIKGSEFTTEFTNIKTAVNSKADTTGDTFTGAVTFDAAVTLNADVTFDTNTLFVDVSENKVGIGTTSPARELSIGDGTGSPNIQLLAASAGNSRIEFGDTDDSDAGEIQYVHSDNYMQFTTNGSERLRIDSSGNVGIGTTSPNYELTVAGGGNNSIQIVSSTTGTGANNGLRFWNTGSSTAMWNYDNTPTLFATNNTERMRIDSSGNVGIGTSSPLGSFHVKNTSDNATPTSVSDSVLISHQSGSYTSGNYYGLLGWARANSNGTTLSAFIAPTMGDSGTYGDLTFGTGVTPIERMRIDSSGNVGIGGNPAAVTHGPHLDLVGNRGTLTVGTGYFEDNGNTNFIGGARSLAFGSAGSSTERMRIDASGNVGIGETSPKGPLHVYGTEYSYFTSNVANVTPNSTTQGIALGWNKSSGAGESIIAHNKGGGSGGGLVFANNDGGVYREDMRIDSSGNLLVGKTTSASSTVGITLEPAGAVVATRDGGECFIANRKTSDGTIIQLRKDQTTVGSIGTRAAFLNIGSGDTGLLFNSTSDRIQPESTTGGARDAAIDIGGSSTRFKDLYRSGSTYSTSDRNKKQDIRDLTDAEARVALVAKGSLKAFRYIDTVEAEGDDANIHFGIIAQDLKAAFEAEGLNADSYQVLKTSTYTDDDGVEQTTYSVCYENLLAFIISAI